MSCEDGDGLREAFRRCSGTDLLHSVQGALLRLLPRFD